MKESNLRREQQDSENPSGLDGKVTRGQLLKTAGVLGAGALLGACGSSSSSGTTGGTTSKSALPPGTVGGPTGFAGAERYQYGADTAAGRAAVALQRFTNNGKKQITLNMRMWSGATGQLTVPFPKGAPSVAALLLQETGVKLNINAIDPTTQISKNLETIATRDGSNHILVTSIEDNGDYAEAGLALNLDEFVSKYQPDWAGDYVGGPAQVAMMTQYNGSTYAVSMDGDYQVWGYRSDLFGDSKNQANFKAKYGYDLAFPTTWSQHADVAAFFTQPSNKLYGSVDLKNPYWGYVNWMMRYVSAGDPNQYYFDTNASPLINSPAGVQATKEHLASMAWTYPDTLSKSWPEEYAAMGAGQAAMGSFFTNVTKFITAGSPLDKGYGKYIRTSVAPGRMVNGKLVRRSVIYQNNQFVVNTFSDSSLHEVAYLVLQWLSSRHIFDWLTGNPAGYMDPNRVSALDDPLVQASYTPYGCAELKQIIPHTAPPILAIRGAREYTQALDTNLQKVLTKQLAPEQAMAQTATAWEGITNRIGREKQIAAIKADRAAWPTVV
ncbi:MAG: extracellular solute-binding protein [Solirubrobacterales bacterium]|nr:extracellular solute-binding protein [Solirubrobacterales bacterium]